MIRNEPTRLAIFDHDGVLVDSLANHQLAWKELGSREGLPITDDFIHKTFGMTNPTILRLLLGDTLKDETLNYYSDLKETCYRDVARGKITLMAGVRELLEELEARGFLLAIGSSSVLPNLLLTIEECGLAGKFAAIASLEDITRGKPDPEVFLKAAQKSGADPVRTVVFEDAPVGIQAAKAAGMMGIGVAGGHPQDQLLSAGADQVVATLERFDVNSLILNLDRREGSASPSGNRRP